MVAAIFNWIVAVVTSLAEISKIAGEVYRESVVRKQIENENTIQSYKDKEAAEIIDAKPVPPDKLTILDRM